MKLSHGSIFPRFLMLLVFAWFTVHSEVQASDKIDLSGIWSFKTDSADVGISQKWYNSRLNGVINLPGTTDDAGLGIPNIFLPELKRPQVSHLTRKNNYLGAAWYSRTLTIPSAWKNKKMTLTLERVIWETRVWIDGKAVEGKQQSLTTPHYFDLTNFLTPGNHTLTVRVDNRKQFDISVNDMAHAYTNETQIMWNGIIGEISCIAEDKVSITSVQVFPDVAKKLAKVKVKVGNMTTKTAQGILTVFATSSKTNEQLPVLSVPFQVKKSGT